MIPRDVLFTDLDREGFALSPDGRQVAWIDVRGGHTLRVGPAQPPLAGRRIALPGPVVHAQFLDDRRVVCTLRASDGGWATAVVGVDGDVTPLRAPQAASVRPIAVRRPGDAVVVRVDPKVGPATLVRVDLGSGRWTPLCDDLGRAEPLLDGSLRLVALLVLTEDGSRRLTRPDRSPLLGPWSPEEAAFVRPIGVDAAGDVLLVAPTRGGFTGVVAVRPTDGTARVVFASTEGDLDDVWWDARAGRLRAVATGGPRRRWTLLDDRARDAWAALLANLDGDLLRVEASADDLVWLVTAAEGDRPAATLRYEAPEPPRLLAWSSDLLASAPTAPTRVTRLAARDGLDLQVTWTGEESDTLAAWIHPGPWAQEMWGYHPWHQWLAARGMSVLSVQYRGSTGRGRAFLDAGDGAWGGAMTTDVIDAVEAAIAQGRATPGRVVAIGSGYGGFAALSCAITRPDLFGAVVDLCGPLDLVALVARLRAERDPRVRAWADRVGTIDTVDGRARLAAASPLTRAADLRCPVLVAGGAQDRRVPWAEVEQLVAALQRHGTPVCALRFRQAGHGLQRIADQRAFAAQAEQFLARHLGTTAEPLGADGAGADYEIAMDGWF